MIQIHDLNWVYPFFKEELGIHNAEDFRGVLHVNAEIGQIADKSDVAVAVGYNAFIGRTCCMHVVIPKPWLLTRKIIQQSFEYPFVIAGVEHVIGLVDSTNQAALDFDIRLGFREVHRIPNGGLTGDLVILQMSRSECRWIGKEHRHGKEEPAAGTQLH